MIGAAVGLFDWPPEPATRGAWLLGLRDQPGSLAQRRGNPTVVDRSDLVSGGAELASQLADRHAFGLGLEDALDLFRGEPGEHSQPVSQPSLFRWNRRLVVFRVLAPSVAHACLWLRVDPQVARVPHCANGASTCAATSRLTDVAVATPTADVSAVEAQVTRHKEPVITNRGTSPVMRLSTLSTLTATAPSAGSSKGSDPSSHLIKRYLTTRRLAVGSSRRSAWRCPPGSRCPGPTTS